MYVCKHHWKKFKTICCEHIKCVDCGVIKKTKLCAFHIEHTNNYVGKDYFYQEDLSNFNDGMPLNKQYIIEHEDVLFDDFELSKDFLLNKSVLEIGCGVGRLVPMFLKHSCDYTGLEYNKWASNFVTNCFNVQVINEDFMKCSFENKYENKFDIVFCIHTLEHFIDSDIAFQKMVSLVKPNGYLFIEVPFKSDLYNPDHYWFFDLKVLKYWGKINNLKCVNALRKTVIKQEDYLYILFKKQGDD